jgi:hypothetical protein
MVYFTSRDVLCSGHEAMRPLFGAKYYGHKHEVSLTRHITMSLIIDVYELPILELWNLERLRRDISHLD